VLALFVLFQGDLAPQRWFSTGHSRPRDFKRHADENFWPAAAISALSSARNFKEGAADSHDDMLGAKDRADW